MKDKLLYHSLGMLHKLTSIISNNIEYLSEKIAKGKRKAEKLQE